jgi:tRNA(fMet)-specific endonuclease VapC
LTATDPRHTRTTGKSIGPDTLIAAQAVARRLTLVSNNRKELGRVPRLAIENWAD